MQGIMKISYVNNDEITSVNNMYWLLQNVLRKNIKYIQSECIWVHMME